MKFRSSDAVYVFVMKRYNVLISLANYILKVKDKMVPFEGGMCFHVSSSFIR